MYKKLSNCKYCHYSFTNLNTNERANHSRWCSNNPKRSTYAAAANCKQMHTAESKQKSKAGIKKAYTDGKYKDVIRKSSIGRKHTEEVKQYLREKALASPHRRLIRSIRDYTKKDGTIIKLDSSWEEALALRLDELNIDWIRPSPIKWVDRDGIFHNYFPDFYLPDYNLYLDPKNPYAIKAQQKKLDCLTEQVKNVIIIKSLEECKSFNIERLK